MISKTNIGAVLIVFMLFLIAGAIFRISTAPQSASLPVEAPPASLSVTPVPSEAAPSKDAPSPEKKETVSQTPILKPPPPTSRTEITVPRAPITPDGTSILEAEVASPVLSQALPPLDEQSILAAVVKIECPLADGLGKYTGSGFAVGGSAVITAAHVVAYSVADICTVIFPRERRPTYFLKGTIDKKEDARRWYEEEGIDVAMLTLPELDSYPEGHAIFKRYPSVPYPLCRDSWMLGDNLLHFGYPSNYVDQNYLSRLEGKALLWAAVAGMREALSEDQTFTYRAPKFTSVSGQDKLAPYMVSRVASFYGDSGGLALNATKQCILGPHHGGTIGKSEGENYTLFSVLGWDGIRGLEGLYEK